MALGAVICQCCQIIIYAAGAGVKVARRHADTVSRGGQRLVTLAGDSTAQYTVHSTAQYSTEQRNDICCGWFCKHSSSSPFL